MSIKDKITTGDWYVDTNYVRSKISEDFPKKDKALGQAYYTNSGDYGEGNANAKLWAASKKMLDILIRLGDANTFDQNEMAILQHDSNKLLKQLNNG